MTPRTKDFCTRYLTRALREEPDYSMAPSDDLCEMASLLIDQTEPADDPRQLFKAAIHDLLRARRRVRDLQEQWLNSHGASDGQDEGAGRVVKTYPARRGAVRPRALLCIDDTDEDTTE